MKSSKQILEIKEGLEKLQNTMRKNDNLKIQAFYKLMSYQCETPSELITININDREIPEGHEKLDKSPKPPLTARRRHRGRNDKKSFALKFKEINCQEELKQSTKREKDHNGLKSELSKEDNELDLQSESDYAIQTFRCSTKSELGNFEEEEQIYLVSDYDDSIDLDNHEKSPFYFNSTQPAMLQNIDISSVGDIKDENNSSMNSHGFSEDFENEKKFCKKISMNKKDIFRMTKQVEEIRKMFNTDS